MTDPRPLIEVLAICPECGDYQSCCGHEPPSPGPTPDWGTEAHSLTVEDLRKATEICLQREHEYAQRAHDAIRGFWDAMPEGIMDSPALSPEEKTFLSQAAGQVATSQFHPMHPEDARRLGARVDEIVRHHERWMKRKGLRNS